MLGHSRFQNLILQRLFYCSHDSITWVIVYPDVFKIMKKAICYLNGPQIHFKLHCDWDILAVLWPGFKYFLQWIFFTIFFSYMLMAFCFTKHLQQQFSNVMDSTINFAFCIYKIFGLRLFEDKRRVNKFLSNQTLSDVRGYYMHDCTLVSN